MENNRICIEDLSRLISGINKVYSHSTLSLETSIQDFWIALENSWTSKSGHCQIHDCDHYHKVVRIRVFFLETKLISGQLLGH